MKKIYSTITIIIFCFVFMGNGSAYSEKLSVYVNGKEINFDIAPQIIEGRTMVPMRSIFENLSAEVEWIPETRKIIGMKDDINITMQIDNVDMMVEDEIIRLDVPPMLLNGRTMVPVRAIAESLGVNVYWYGEIKTVAVYNPEVEITYIPFYNLKGENVKIDKNFEAAYLELGWSHNISDIKTIMMYAPDGRTKQVYIGNIDSEIASGWYTEPVTTMYSMDGRTIVAKMTEVETNKQAGWYENVEEVTQNIYSVQGVKVVYKAELDSYLQQGWRTWPFPIEATDMCSYERNIVDGIKLNWWARNTSGKTINYYTVTVYFVNPVGDLAYDEITGKPYKTLNYVGPVKPDETVGIYTLVGYVGACEAVIIGDVEIEYSDKTKESIWCGQIAQEGNILSKWGGLILPEPK